MNFYTCWARLALAFSVSWVGVTVAQAQVDPVVLTINAPAAAAPSVVTFNIKRI